MKLLEETLESIPVKRPKPTKKNPQGMCLDKGYDYPEVRQQVEKKGYTPHIRARGEDVPSKMPKGWKPRRWVVERTHGWINRYRRMLVRWEKKPENYRALLHFVFAIVAFRAAGFFG